MENKANFSLTNSTSLSRTLCICFCSLRPLEPPLQAEALERFAVCCCLSTIPSTTIQQKTPEHGMCVDSLCLQRLGLSFLSRGGHFISGNKYINRNILESFSAGDQL